jgi:glyoxylase-like metal-dependent hydrolase (beta-lactamase superfamily II)
MGGNVLCGRDKSDVRPGRSRMPGNVCTLVVAALVASTTPACKHEDRVPYIPPTLQNWQHPYHGREDLKLHVFHTGMLHALGGLALNRQGKLRRQDLPVLAYVLEHPRQGLVVIDTGLNRDFVQKAEHYLGGLVGMIVEAELAAGEDLPAQMLSAGLDPAKVRKVVLSNLRFYHAGEAEAFKKATVVVSKAEHQTAVEGASGYVLREFDEIESWEFVDVHRDGQPLGTLQAALDLFGDGSLILIDAPGPTAGNMAVMIRFASRAVVRAGDLAPLPETLRYAARPAWLADPDAWWDTIWHLKRFCDLEPALLVVPGNSADPLRDAALPQVRVHEFVAPTVTPKP